MPWEVASGHQVSGKSMSGGSYLETDLHSLGNLENRLENGGM